jgi:hypothetical protein
MLGSVRRAKVQPSKTMAAAALRSSTQLRRVRRVAPVNERIGPALDSGPEDESFGPEAAPSFPGIWASSPAGATVVLVVDVGIATGTGGIESGGIATVWAGGTTWITGAGGTAVTSVFGRGWSTVGGGELSPGAVGAPQRGKAMAGNVVVSPPGPSAVNTGDCFGE